MEDDLEVPQMKVVKKPKNLKKRKRKREEDEDLQAPIESKKNKTEESETESGLSKLEETKLLQQMRASRPKGSDMSSEDVQYSRAAIAMTDEQTIGSLVQNFTVQKEKVNTLDNRMEEFIEQEMAKRRPHLHEKAASEEVQPEVAAEEAKVIEAEAELEAKEQAEKEVGGLTTEVSSHPPPVPDLGFNPVVIDLSHTTLRAISSTAVNQANFEPERRHHRQTDGGARTTAGILEVDLPMDEQLKMIERTRDAALKAMRESRKRKPRPHSATGFEDIDGDLTITGNLSSDFSRHRKYQPSGQGRATDEQLYDRYRKKQSNMFR